MSLLYPSMLFGLLAVSIPIIVHLFNFRKYKTVYFSNISFLKNIKQETKAKSQLKHLLILFSRILAIIFLVFAFAQPFIPVSTQHESNAGLVSVYVDNSFSMDADGETGKILEAAKSKASEIAEAYPASTKFILVTNDFYSKNQHPISRDQFQLNVSDIQSSPIVRNTSEIVSKFNSFKDFGIKQMNYYLSDFQKSSTDFSNVSPDTSMDYYLMPFENTNYNNLYIDSGWFETPEHKLLQTESFNIKIVNKSEETYQNISLKLFINDTLKAVNSFNIDKTSEKIINLSYTNTTNKIIRGKVEITDYPIVYDNVLYFSYLIPEQISVLSIYNKEPNLFINSLLDDTLYNVSSENVKNLNYSEFKTYNVIILDQIEEFSTGLTHEIEQYVANGGTLVFFPSNKCNLSSYNFFFEKLNLPQTSGVDTLKTQIRFVNTENNIFKNVFKKLKENSDLPIVNSQLLYQKSNSLSEVILETKNNMPVLAYYPFSKGKIYLFSINLTKASGNFATHPIFIPTMINIINNSSTLMPIYYSLGDNVNIDYSYNSENANTVFKIKNESSDFEFIPFFKLQSSGLNINISNEISVSGNYIAFDNESALFPLSFNYKRSESDLTSYSFDDIQNWINTKANNCFYLLENKNIQISKQINEINSGLKLWKFALALALLFLIFEMLLLRFLKKGKRMKK